LHVIYDTVDETHETFAQKAEAHWLLVKVFSKSHGRHPDTWLSIVDKNGAVLTLDSDDFRGGLHILHYEDARRNLSSIMQKKTPLASVMGAQREFENRYCRRAKPWILIVDGEARPLRLPCGSHHSLSEAAVTIAITAPANPLRDHGCLGLRAQLYGKSNIVRASMGGSEGLGFAVMRHSEQQLAHYIELNSKMSTWTTPTRAPWCRQAARAEDPKIAYSEKTDMDHADAENELADVDAETVMSENAETLTESDLTDNSLPDETSDNVLASDELVSFCKMVSSCSNGVVEDKGTLAENDVDSWDLEEVLSRAPWKIPFSRRP
jgi:hypothetical protein